MWLPTAKKALCWKHFSAAQRNKRYEASGYGLYRKQSGRDCSKDTESDVRQSTRQTKADGTLQVRWPTYLQTTAWPQQAINVYWCRTSDVSNELPSTIVVSQHRNWQGVRAHNFTSECLLYSSFASWKHFLTKAVCAFPRDILWVYSTAGAVDENRSVTDPSHTGDKALQLKGWLLALSLFVAHGDKA